MGLSAGKQVLRLRCTSIPHCLENVISFLYIIMSSNSERRGRKPYAVSLTTASPHVFLMFSQRPPPPDESGDGQWVHDMAPSANESRKPRPNTSNTGSEPTRLLVSNLHYEVTQKDLSVCLTTNFASGLAENQHFASQFLVQSVRCCVNRPLGYAPP